MISAGTEDCQKRQSSVFMIPDGHRASYLSHRDNRAGEGSSLSLMMIMYDRATSEKGVYAMKNSSNPPGFGV